MVSVITRNRQLRFRPRPGASFGPELFELCEEETPRPREGQVLIRNAFISCDPTQVSWLFASSSYAPRVAPGDVMRAWCAGHVVESRHPDFRAGDRVWGTLGWQDYALSDGTGVLPLARVPDDIPLSHPLGVTGINGITAYLGLLEIARVRAGDCVVVSTAAGATGSAAVQIARRLGARVVAIAGGPVKCAWLTSELQQEHTIDYKSENVAAKLRALCPDGVDVYFDNVGGELLDTVLAAMAPHGRIAMCGATSQYHGQPTPLRNGLEVLARKLTMQGFVLFDYRAEFERICAQLCEWAREGALRAKEDVAYGLMSAPSALLRLFEGKNLGKQLVRLEGAEQALPGSGPRAL